MWYNLYRLREKDEKETEYWMSLQTTPPRFNLGYVIRETGIKPDTLRAWERRYGLPEPARTSGGHRLYSREDIETVRWLLQQQQEGLSISKAVKLWNSLTESGQNPLLRIPEEGEKGKDTTARYHTRPASSLAELCQQWVKAGLNYDSAAAEVVLSRAFAEYPMKDVLHEVLQCGMAETGRLWFEKKATIQQEHFISSLALQRLHSLIAAAPAPTLRGKVLIGGTVDEAHEFAPLLINLLLRYRGWEVIYLGANVPELQLEAALQKTTAQLVILTAEQLHTAANLLDTALFLQAQGVQLGYGGAIFNHLPELRQRIPGHFLGTRIEEALDAIEELLIHPVPAPASRPPSLPYQAVLSVFREKQRFIEAEAWKLLQESGLPYERLRLTNFYFSRAIEAALRLGDIRFVEREIDWAGGLIANYDYSIEQLQVFLQAYQSVLREQLAGKGSLIVDWLEERLTWQ